MDLSAPYLELSEHIKMVPVAHGVQAYADEVRRAVHLYQPACIAVELPRMLREDVLELVGYLPEIRLLCYRLPGGAAYMIPGNPCDSLIEGVRLAQEHGLELEFIDTIDSGGQDEFEFLPDDLAIGRIGLASYAEEVLRAPPDHEATDREQTMASRLRILEERHERILFIGGMGHFKNLKALLGGGDGLEPNWDEPVPEVKIEVIGERRLGHVLMEVPYTAYLYEMFRWESGPEERFPMLSALQHVLKMAADTYKEEFDEQVNLTEWRAIYQYGRNLALVRSRLRPRLYELLTAAKSCVDDDYGAICLDQAISYPPNKKDDSANLLPDEVDVGGHKSLTLYVDFDGELERLQHAYPHPEVGEMEFSFQRRPRPTDAQKQAWRDAFISNPSSICSWPPEDVFIENLFRVIRQRAFLQISDFHSASEEFTSSALDGLDMRETMRHWHTKKIYVRRERIPPGRVGPVVLVWRDTPLEYNNVWRTCLYAENDNESDIAFYSKPLAKEMVGPGISRTEYYGILSVFPAGGIPDVWSISWLYRWRTSGRLLVAAAIILSQEKYIAVVDKHPPDAELRSFARLNGKSIIYLPLTTFSKTLLKRARKCHILQGRRVRRWAGDYIPKI